MTILFENNIHKSHFSIQILSTTMSFSILSLWSRSGRSGGGLKKKRGLEGDSMTLTTFLSKMASAADSHNVVGLQNDDKRPPYLSPTICER